MSFLVFLLLLISSVVCHQEYQTIPLRHDAAINYLIQHQHSNFTSLLDGISTYTIALNEISSYISLFSNNEVTQCEQDFEIILQAILKRDTWALKVFDAWGKPLPSGILKGNTYWVGSYDECLQPMYLPTNKSFISQPFDTQHCTLHLDLSTSQQITGVASLVLGICVPSSCHRQDVVSLMHTLLNISNIKEDDLLCSNDPANGQSNLTTGAIATIIILSLLALLVLVGTIIDIVFMSKIDSVNDINAQLSGYNHLIDSEPRMSSRDSYRSRMKSKPYVIFLAEFSALKTLRQIFTIKQKNNNESYQFLNGIRVLSLFWVIIGHSFLFNILFTSNILDIFTWSRNISMQLILNATFSVDTFFVLSGFLTTILFVRHVEKQGKLSIRLIILYYVHRYIRLTPTFLLVILISINLTPYFGNGPAYPTQVGFEAPQCRSEYWWTSILYVGNIVKPDYMCLPISWYLHNDMQFHWIAPLSLIPFVIGRKAIGFIVSILFTLIGIGSIAGLLIYYPSLQASNSLTPPQTGPSFFNTIYITPWCRISAYFIGVLTGFFVINIGRSYRMKKSLLIICNITAILFALICLFAIYPDEILVPGIDKTSFIIYQSLSRTLWSMAIGWLLFLCMTNQGGIVNKILSWSFWVPLARLNYSTYLIHLTVIYMSITNQRIPFYYQPHLVVNNFVSHIFFSYTTAILIFIFIETPFFIIEKTLFKR
ncbi:unnamed protein product [Adineta steineri]|uniref:Nose resistant-to-fluoxetine protein N-terminal domain-containing protein n=1 Tax=Adineta steineri TaxID=433720 RepID=A0A814PMX0_9BILA|nr:unnamed protein product [Adineta steineri]CAF1108153.1 unnamed protein product [Adineta steineri]